MFFVILRLGLEVTAPGGQGSAPLLDTICTLFLPGTDSHHLLEIIVRLVVVIVHAEAVVILQSAIVLVHAITGVQSQTAEGGGRRGGRLGHVRIV